MLQDPALSIGILAYNEELRIAETLRELFAQDVFAKFPTELIIVANGCTDKTVSVAKESLTHHESIWSGLGSARVENLSVGGKTNAWNRFVHNLSSAHAPMLVLMDADIAFSKPNTISSMVETLKSNTQAVICVDRPVKDIEISTQRTIFQRLLVAATPAFDPNSLGVCGQLYCALSSKLRQIKMPLDIAGPEDGFLRALLLTDGFTRPENMQRIVFDPNAQHIFASVATWPELYKHEVWLVTGSIVNMFLFERFATECAAGQSAMSLMDKWQEQDPQWLRQYALRQAKERGWNLLPRSWWTRRWSRLRGVPFQRKLQRLPVAVAATAVDVWIFLVAIRNVRRGRFGNWRR